MLFPPGEVNSIVKTDASGKIRVQALKLGGNDTYEILTLDTTSVVFKTPGQGEILRASGAGTSTPVAVAVSALPI